MAAEAGDNMFSSGPGFCFGWEIKLNRYGMRGKKSLRVAKKFPPEIYDPWPSANGKLG